jgi:hypothetical protein
MPHRKNIHIPGFSWHFILLFSEISKNLAGRPLESFETVLKYIRTTKTSTGLTGKLVIGGIAYRVKFQYN